MNFQLKDALTIADQVYLGYTGKTLGDPEMHVLRGSWQGKTYEQMANETYGSYKVNYLKNDVGPNLWRQLSKALGQEVSKANFRAALERRWRSLYTDSSPPQEAIPILSTTEIHKVTSKVHIDRKELVSTSDFYGRENELSLLKGWILEDRCRLLAVVGEGGIGKTSLTGTLTREIQGEFEYFVWRSLRNLRSLNRILTDVIEFLSDHEETEKSLSIKIEDKIYKLIEYCNRKRCLIVLDNFESVLENHQSSRYYKENYEDYGKLIKYLAEADYQSCFVLTSREIPQEIADVAGVKLSVRILRLHNLEKEAVRTLLQANELMVSRNECQEQELEELLKFYHGNPLFLKIISTIIKDLFDGNISHFLQQKAKIFNNIKSILSDQFNLLSDLDKQVMYWISINREPISISSLQEDIYPLVTPQQLLESLTSLQRRSLIEPRPNGFTQQPVLMEYVTEELIEQVSKEIETGEIKLMISHALIKAQSTEYIKEVQDRMILEPIANKLRIKFISNEEIRKRLNQVLSKIKEKFPNSSGYGPANIIHLLKCFKIDLKGWDFSKLNIWQAELQGLDLQDVNFADSNFKNSEFTKTFGSVLAVAFSLDGQFLAFGDANSEIRLWKVIEDRLQPLQSFCGHKGWVRSVTFSPDGQTLASAGAENTVKLWNVATGKCLRDLEGHKGWVRSVAFSPDGRTLASSSTDGTVKLWNVATGKCLRTLEGHKDWVRSVAFSPDGQTLASSSNDYTVKLWNVATGKCLRTLEGHKGWVRSVAFSPDGQNLASGGADGTVKLWDISRDIEAPKLMDFPIQSDGNGVWSVAFSPDGTVLAAGGDNKIVCLWDVKTGRYLKPLEGHTDWVQTIAFNPSQDNLILASGSHDQAIKLWDVNAGECLRTLQGYTRWIRSIAFSPGKLILASGSTDHAVRLWDIERGTRLNKIRMAHTGWIQAVAFSPDQDNLILASGSNDNTVKLWDVKTGKCLQTLKEHTNWVWCVVFSSDGQFLASGSDDSTVRLWHFRDKNWQLFKCLEGHDGVVWSVAFSPDGRSIASGSNDNSVKLWDVKTGECLKTLKGHKKHVKSVAFSPDGLFIASGGDDYTVKLWDVKTGECIKTLKGHTNWVWSVAFSSDGRFLASGSQDETIKLWSVENQTHKFEFVKTLRISKLYQGMNIKGSTGLEQAERETLKTLGAENVET